MKEEDMTQVKAQQLASEALQDLAHPDTKVSSIIEKVLRISTMLNDTYWRAWCKLQLMENSDTEAIKRFQEQFTQDEKQTVGRALMDYAESRHAPLLGEGKIFGSPIADLEYSFAFFEQRLQQEPTTIPVEVFKSGEEQRKMLNGIRAQVRDYLIDLENKNSSN